MKYLLSLLLLITACGSVQAQANKRLAKDTIVWKQDSLLVKGDFQSKHKGSLSASAAIGLFIHPEDHGGALLLHVEAVFSKSKSYMKEDSPYILNHQQVYFDICEVHARKLRQLIHEKDFKKVKDVVQTIQKMMDKESAAFAKEVAEYDEDTQYGLNAAKQQVWNDKVKAELAELEQFSSSLVDIAAN